MAGPPQSIGMPHDLIAPEKVVGTLLEQEHVSLGGHMVDFHGWRMPLYYQSTGILEEHKAVRSKVGIFDVSHMGIMTLHGDRAHELISRRTPADARNLKTGSCKYTFFLGADGKIIDDAVLTRLDAMDLPKDYLLIVNASMTQRIREILQQHRLTGTDISTWNGTAGIIAVQGPASKELIERVFKWDVSPLKFYTGAFFPLKGGSSVPFDGSFVKMMQENLFVSRTGYTGELGFELFVPAEQIVEFWRRLVKEGAVPCGLGARDTLRMEKGYLLSGTDFQQDRTPIECGLDRFLSMGHDFVGRPALEKQLKEGGYPVFTGIAVQEKGSIPRTGTAVMREDKIVGRVSSGGLSPTLGYGIALSFLPQDCRGDGVKLELDIRGRKVPATSMPLPFVR